MIAVIDYGAGNLFSVKNALNFLGAENKLTSSVEDIRSADGLILPGVGAFPDAMEMLRQSGLISVIKEEAVKKPFLGICLGMQLLFETGYEFTLTQGLGLLEGSVRLIEGKGLKIPHMGWNQLQMQNDCPLLRGISEGESVYFVHSYMAQTSPQNIMATAEYGEQVTALVAKGNLYGAQFHPEKSGETGLRILRNFKELCQ